MSRLISICIALFFFGVFFTSIALAQESFSSPFNGKVLDYSNTQENYSFILAGHIYGSPTSTSVYPSVSFISNIDMINHNNVTFLILMGDIYGSARPPYIENFKKSIISKIDVPMFNAVGNHDVGSHGYVENRELYVENFGHTIYDFTYGSEMYIILDGEIDQGEITGEQLGYLKDVIEQAIKTNDVKNVFIIVHKLIWTVGNNELHIIKRNKNSQNGYAKSDNFQSVVLPEIARLSQTKNVYVASGDIGVSWSFPLFYHRDEKYNITYIASGIGDTERDAIIKVDILDGDVIFTPISLTGEELHELNYYDVNFWSSYFGNRNPLYERIIRISNNIYFQFGVIVTTIIFSIFVVTATIYTRRKKL